MKIQELNVDFICIKRYYLRHLQTHINVHIYFFYRFFALINKFCVLKIDRVRNAFIIEGRAKTNFERKKELINYCSCTDRLSDEVIIQQFDATIRQCNV